MMKLIRIKDFWYYLKISFNNQCLFPNILFNVGNSRTPNSDSTASVQWVYIGQIKNTFSYLQNALNRLTASLRTILSCIRIGRCIISYFSVILFLLGESFTEKTASSGFRLRLYFLHWWNICLRFCRWFHFNNSIHK